MFKNYTPIPADNEPKFLGIFTKNKTFYKGFFSLLVLIALQMLAAFTVNLVDNIMLGTYSETALSGATLVNQLQFILQMIASGIGLGIVVLSSQYWGQRRLDPIKKVISIGLKCGFLLGLLFTVATALFPQQILGIFTNDTTVVAEGVKYLRIMCWTYVIFAVSNSLMHAMQSVETASIGTIMSCSTIVINFCLNFTLIYGHFGAPELGIRGAAIATLISRCVELIIVLLYILVIDKKLHTKVKELFQFDFTYLRDYLKVAMPVVITGALWGIGQAVQTMILGHISATTIAANSIATVIYQIFTVVDACFIWLFTLPSAFLSAFVFHWPPLVTFCFLKADQVLKCIPNSINVNRYRWAKVLTK